MGEESSSPLHARARGPISAIASHSQLDSNRFYNL